MKKEIFDSIDQISQDLNFFEEIESPMITAMMTKKHYEIVPLGDFAELWRGIAPGEIE